MSVDINIKCDQCRDRIADGDSVVCNACYDSINTDLQNSRDREEDLESQLQEAKDTIEKLVAQLKDIIDPLCPQCRAQITVKEL